MAAKPRSARPFNVAHPARVHRRGVALAAIVTTISSLTSAGPSLADTGGVYFDGNANAGAGDPAHLFNATFTGFDNVGLGHSVMPNLTTGDDNVAAGAYALQANTSGDANIATGFNALASNTTGNFNVATGGAALANNTTGHESVATGTDALFLNGGGHDNVAAGTDAMYYNHDGFGNVAAGTRALYLSGGNNNVASGLLARHAGCAPLEASSGARRRHRFSRRGNRQLNSAFHRIAVTQARISPEARSDLERKRAEGKSTREALRCLKRQIVRRAFKLLRARVDEKPTPSLTELDANSDHPTAVALT